MCSIPGFSCFQHLPDTEWLPLARRIMGTSYYVTGLSPDNNYAFRVMADNDFGSSRPSLPARMPRLAGKTRGLTASVQY